MSTGRTLALDIGQKRTGIAISDELGIIATPLMVVEEGHKGRWADKITEIINENNVAQLVVGIPLNQYGQEGQDAKAIKEYVTTLGKRITIPIIEWDERFTTVQAERRLVEADLSRKKRKKVIDKIAAAIILQNYLDGLNSKINH